MKIEIDWFNASNLLELLEEQNRSYMHCILNFVGEKKTWRALIKRNKALAKALKSVKR